MRVKQILSFVPLPTANIRLVYSRITSSRLTTAFFLLSFLHFLLQVAFQAWAFQINASAGAFLSDILTAGNLAPQSVFAVLVPLASDGQSGGELHLCSSEDMQAHDDIYQCPVVWKGRNSTSTSESTVTYVITVPSSTSASTSTSITHSSTASARPTLAPGATTPKEDILVVGSGREAVDNDNDSDSLDDGSASSNAGALAARDESFSRMANRITWRRGIPVEPVFNTTLVQPGSASTDTDLVGVRLPSFMNVTTGTMGIMLSEQCVQMIVWPNQIIHNTKREDVTFIGFQIWVLGMSTVAILNESIPHTLAGLATHVLATAWSGYQLVNTASFQSEFVRSTIKSGLCGGGSVNLLPNYWVERRAAEVTVLVVNIVSLLLSAALSWRLVKMFGWQTFKRIGASLEINRVYKIVLTFSIGLQVAFFFIIAAVALWLDVLFRTILGANAENVVVYKTFGILVTLFMLPWLGLGWFAVRRETQKLMCIFLASCLVLLIGWGFMFLSSTFRWEITEWKFFATMTGASIALLVLTTLLGVVCFYNFDKGLKRFLGTMDGMSDDRDEFTRVVSHDMEKDDIVVDFPVSGPIPTYAVAFGGTNKPQSQSPVDRSNSLRSIESTPSASLGSPLHDPVFFDPSPDYPHLQVPTTAVPPRFRSRDNSTVEFSGASSTGASVDRNDSTTSTDSGSNPFSLDLERRNSSGSSASVRTHGTNMAKTYAKPGSNFTPTIMSKHVRDGSSATSSSSGTGKRWVID